jgi:SAM-dependent methyltransferase
MPHLRAGIRLLDVGCGPGTITADFARRLAPGAVVGLDASTQVIAEARRDHPGIPFTIGDVYRMDFPDASFDIVHAHQLLQHLVDPVAALKEMRRVTAPGGIVAVRDSDYGSFTWHPGDDRLVRWLELERTAAILMPAGTYSRGRDRRSSLRSRPPHLSGVLRRHRIAIGGEDSGQIG